MQAFHDFDHGTALPVGWGVRILALSASAKDPMVTRLSALGGPIETETELYAALSALIDDPSGYGLFVMNCDGLGGAEAGHRAMATLAAVGSRVPVILISAEHQQQQFPQSREAAVCLRAPLSAVSLRVGFEHALRGRLLWNNAA